MRVIKRHERMGIVALASVLMILSTAALGSSQDGRLAEARREGKVVWYTGAALKTAERVAGLFEQAHPVGGIKTKAHPGLGC